MFVNRFVLFVVLRLAQEVSELLLSLVCRPVCDCSCVCICECVHV